MDEQELTNQDSPSTAGAPDEVQQALEALQKERDGLFERLARVSADYQNYQRRMEQNLLDSINLARGDMLKQFIPVVDHFDTALSREPQSDDAKAIHEGVRIVRDELLKVLQCAGVERIDVKVGEAFDPHIHEAMMRHKAQGVAPHHVTMAMQPGYLYKGRTLRPAKVAVAPEES
jgi:molecular chaperone GrpE